MSDEVTVHLLDVASAAQIIDNLVALYVEVYADSNDEFFGEERFRRQLQGHMTAPGWRTVTATVGNKLVGFIYGFALAGKTSWWKGLLGPPRPDFTLEDGQRTVAVSELLVAPGARRAGIGRRLHDEFLRTRSEHRATLLVEPDNTIALQAYLRWGWQPEGQLRPSWPGAPLYQVLVRPLIEVAEG